MIRQLRSKLRSKWKLGPEGEQLVFSLKVCFGSKIPSVQREPAAKAASESNLGASDKGRLMWRARWCTLGSSVWLVQAAHPLLLAEVRGDFIVLWSYITTWKLPQPPRAEAPDYKEMNLKLKERCYVYQTSQELSTESSGEDGVRVTGSLSAPAPDPLSIKQQSCRSQRDPGSVIPGRFPSSAGPVQDVLNMSTAHLHSGHHQPPLGRRGYSTSEAVRVQGLKKELCGVRDTGRPSEVRREGKRMRKGRDRQNFGAMFFMK